MAKSKTFTTGQPLSAAEINTYLNPDVPAVGLPIKADWADIIYAASPNPVFTHSTLRLQVKRVGEQLFFRGDPKLVSGNMQPGIVYTIGTLPSGYQTTLPPRATSVVCSTSFETPTVFARVYIQDNAICAQVSAATPLIQVSGLNGTPTS